MNPQICTLGMSVLLAELAQRVYGPSTAGEFVNKYRSIEVIGLKVEEGEIRRSGVIITTAATAYVNNGHKVARTNPNYVTPGKRHKLQEILLSLDDNRELKRYVSFDKVGARISVSNGREELFSYTANAIKQSLMGKGSPEQVKQTANLMNLWRVFQADVKERNRSTSTQVTDSLTPKAAKKEGTDQTTYQYSFPLNDIGQLVRDYLGVDCNGFVNLYLMSKYPDLTIRSAHEMEDVYVQGGKHQNKVNKNLRNSTEEIQPDDAVVFYKNHYHHIAVVNTVFRRNQDIAVVSLAESRGSSMGGVQTNTFTIRRQTTKYQFSIDGRNEEFVKIVAPDRWKP